MNCKIAQNDARLLEALLTTRTIHEAAQESGISERQIYYRLADPDFQELYQKLKQQQIESISAQINRLSQLALLELEEILTSSQTSTKDRLAAARIVLNVSRVPLSNYRNIQ